MTGQKIKLSNSVNGKRKHGKGKHGQITWVIKRTIMMNFQKDLAGVRYNTGVSELINNVKV